MYYYTLKYAKIPNTFLAVLNYLLMLTVLAYVCVYSIWLQKGYQEFDNVVGASTLKVKGSARAKGGLFFDDKDLVFPARAASGELFITTNAWATLNQTRGNCTGEVPCTSNSDCKANKYTNNGMLTGHCPQASGGNPRMCQIEAWCPLEAEPEDYLGMVMNGVEDWTILVRTDVLFPKFDQSFSNADQEVEMGVNLFTIESLLEMSGHNYSDTSEKGGIFGVDMQYDCDLDKHPDHCDPEMVVTRFDIPGSASYGYNFREASYDYGTDTPARRQIKKRYGIRFIFEFSGQAGRFSPVMLLLAIGAGAGLLGVASVVCDQVLFYCSGKQKGEFYSESVFEETKYDGPEEDDENQRLCG